MFESHIAAGIRFLYNAQQKDGSFLSLSSTNPHDYKNARTYHTTFVTSLILSCLNGLTQTSEVQKMKQKAVSFLLTQKSKDWSFNYWVRRSKEATIMPYPDDLDDTFCALAALFEYRPQILDGAAFATIIGILTSTEVREGGPYRTWLVTEGSADIWKDVDIAVNSNIAYFLSKQQIELPNITELIETAIESNSLSSPYYYSNYPILYFISRFYKGPSKNKIQRLLSKSYDWDNSLHIALRIVALLNLDIAHRKVSQSVQALLIKQSNGHWAPYGFYIDPVIDGKKYYAGSAELTTAFCISALDRYQRCMQKDSKKSKLPQENKLIVQIRAQILNNTNHRFMSIDRRVKDELTPLLEEILAGDASNQITLLPYYIAENTSEISVPRSLLIQLGTASLYGWIAYTIYDNFLDDEGSPKMLPIANIALRELTILFTTALSKKPEFTSFFHQIMDNLENANSWEVRNCRVNIQDNSIQIDRIPDYGTYAMLAYRSMGHVIAPAAVLYFLGYKKTSPEMKKLIKFFQYYLIARQLNDDAHDFEKDLRRGHINAVCAKILKELKKKQGNRLPSDLTILLKMVNEQFWNESLVSVCNEILSYAEKARKNLTSNVFIKKKNVFEEMLATIELSANKALEEHANVTKFLKTYRS